MNKCLNSLKRIFGVVVDILLVVLICFTIYVISCNAAGRVPKILGYSVLKVITGSMEPSIYKGDFIILVRMDSDKLEEGDIIAFYSEDPAIHGKPNTHRIISVLEDGSFITKGDANETKDSISVSPERIIGKYTRKARFIKWVSSLASPKKILFLFAILPLLGVSVYEIFIISKIGRESILDKEQRQNKEKEKIMRKAVEKEKQRLYDEAERQKRETDKDGG